MRTEQRGHWQNEETCLIFLEALNLKHLEEGSSGNGFSLSGHQHFEWFCCCLEPLLSVVHLQRVSHKEVSARAVRKGGGLAG